MRNKSFAVFILSNRRPHKVTTVATLRKHGYTGKIYIIIDNEDEQLEEYKRTFGEEVIVFDKAAAAAYVDTADNFDNHQGVVYARNYSFKIAADLGLEYFAQYDDDYLSFAYRYNDKAEYIWRYTRSLDRILDSFIDFQRETGCKSIAFSQTGDFIGGSLGGFARGLTLKRKAMNTFIFKTDDPVRFLGRINEDATLYIDRGTVGDLFFTYNGIALQQVTTQKSAGGMTTLYLDNGTYIKSFYSVLYQPSCVKVGMLGGSKGRLHHRINWSKTAPKILRETLKKGEDNE